MGEFSTSLLVSLHVPPKHREQTSCGKAYFKSKSGCLLSSLIFPGVKLNTFLWINNVALEHHSWPPAAVQKSKALP